MKVWELEEGKEYILSSLGYNEALELDFTKEGET